MTSTRHERVRTEILEAAAHAISVNGYHGMSMRQLAKETNKGLSTFYNYFSSKEDVLFSIQSRAFSSLLASAEEASLGVDGAANRLYAFIHNHVRYFTEHSAVMRVLVHEAAALPPRRRKAIRTAKERYFQLGRERVRAMLTSADNSGASIVDAAEVERVTYSVFGMLNWIYGWYDPDVHGTSVDVARTIHRMATCGMATRYPRRLMPDSDLDVRFEHAGPPAPLEVQGGR